MSFIDKNIKIIKIVSLIILFVFTFVVVIYLKYYYTPGHGVACFTYKYFGIYCMGCGNTRQLYYALDGQFAKAFSYNVACVAIYPTYAFLYYLVLRWVLYDKKVGYKQAYILATVAILLSVYMILRNIPLSGLDILRPPR